MVVVVEWGCILIKLPALRSFGFPFSFFLLYVFFVFGVYTLILLHFAGRCCTLRRNIPNDSGTYLTYTLHTEQHRDLYSVIFFE